MSSRGRIFALALLVSGTLGVSYEGGTAAAHEASIEAAHAASLKDAGCDGPPVVYRTIRRRDTLSHGVYEAARQPSLYGWRKRQVLLHPGEVIWRETPPVYKTVQVKETTPGEIVWRDKSVCGQEVIKCKAQPPPRTIITEKQVLVQPGKRWAEHRPPVYGWVEERVLLRPYKNFAIYSPEQYRWARERVAIIPEGGCGCNGAAPRPGC